MNMEEGIKDILEFDVEKHEDFYKALGCDELSSKEQIIAEYRARVLNCHPDKHPDNQLKAKEFELLQTAREILTDDEKRRNYDKWRRAGVTIPYKTWAGMKETVHTSMHWASPKKEYMIEPTDARGNLNKRSPAEQVIMQSNRPSGDLSFIRTGADSRQDTVPWKRESPSEMLKKFRNYEI